LDSNLAAVRNALSSFRCLRLHSSGTRLVYTIADAVKRGNEPLLELCRDSISLRFFFAKPDRGEYTNNLLRFLSILAYLKELYSIDFTGVYSYVIEALRNSWSFSVLEDRPRDDVLSQRIDALSGVNATLSHEFVVLSREKRKLEKRVQAYRRFCAEVLEKASSAGGTGEAGQHAVLYSLGVDNAAISAIASLLAEKE
jgi:hypothetical protein